jgi:ornithine cyclodeaminase/alanine dehydrogenase-like protein (mu-crystallin family)
MSLRDTLLLSKAYIHDRIAADAFLPAMREAFLALDRGELQNPSPGHLRGEGGGVHIKAAAGIERFGKIVVKMNANFPGNPARGLPTIQGVVALFDARSGELLALMDSIEITARRTAAASALAAQHLARADSTRLGMVGCGMQAAYHLEALRDVSALTHVTCTDVDERRADAFARQAESLGLIASSHAPPRNVRAAPTFSSRARRRRRRSCVVPMSVPVVSSPPSAPTVPASTNWRRTSWHPRGSFPMTWRRRLKWAIRSMRSALAR